MVNLDPVFGSKGLVYSNMDLRIDNDIMWSYEDNFLILEFAPYLSPSSLLYCRIAPEFGYFKFKLNDYRCQCASISHN